MKFILSPLPHMEDQRFFPAHSSLANVPYVGGIFKTAIDPICGRYCLKSLLKWHRGRVTGNFTMDIELEHQYSKPQFNQQKGTSDFVLKHLQNLTSNWFSYAPILNFTNAQAMIEEGTKPKSIIGWNRYLNAHGPIILGGVFL